MKRIRDRVAGLDIHRDTVVACCRVVDPDGSVHVSKKTFATTRKGLSELVGFCSDEGVETVAMEATGIYWRAPYYALEGLFSELWLCNASHVKNVPGRKTDLSDAEWLADVAAHGMVRPSFVPPPEIRELRELTRYRKTQADARGREIQRLEKALQDAGVKITSVASSVWSKSSREIIEALIAGERNPAVLAEMAKGRSPSSKRPLLATSAPITRSSAVRSSTTSTSSITRSLPSPRRSPPASSLLRRRSPSSPRSRGSRGRPRR